MYIHIYNDSVANEL